MAVTTAATARITDVTAPAVRGAAIAAFGIAANIAMTLTPATVDGLLRGGLINMKGAFLAGGHLGQRQYTSCLAVQGS